MDAKAMFPPTILRCSPIPGTNKKFGDNKPKKCYSLKKKFPTEIAITNTKVGLVAFLVVYSVRFATIMAQQFANNTAVYAVVFPVAKVESRDAMYRTVSYQEKKDTPCNIRPSLGQQL